jgi:Arc-like DNA binding domain
LEHTKLGKRGPAPRKGAPTTIRLEPELREQLAAAASAGNRSLSEEIAVRLVQSFSGESDLAGFDDLKTYALCRLIAATLADVRIAVGHPWHEHPLAFEGATEAIMELISYFKPIADVAVPNDHPVLRSLRQMGVGDEKVADMTETIRTARFGLQLGRLMIEKIELGAAPELHDVGGVLNALIAAAGMVGEATAEEDAAQKVWVGENNEAAALANAAAHREKDNGS